MELKLQSSYAMLEHRPTYLGQKVWKEDDYA